MANQTLARIHMHGEDRSIEHRERHGILHANGRLVVGNVNAGITIYMRRICANVCMYYLHQILCEHGQCSSTSFFLSDTAEHNLQKHCTQPQKNPTVQVMSPPAQTASCRVMYVHRQRRHHMTSNIYLSLRADFGRHSIHVFSRLVP